MTDAELAAQLASTAGRILLELRAGALFAQAALGKIGDAVANEFLVRALREARPDDGLLSEETACDGARLAKTRVWIVDPVDGTREYGEARADWAVHVALAIDGMASVGAVALPDLGVVVRSDEVGPLSNPPAVPRIAVSRTRAPRVALAAAEAIGATLLPMGSAGAKAMAVVRGEAEAYLHAGGQNEWDSCAPVAVAVAHGLHCSRIDGSPLAYNRVDVSLPDLLICRPELARPILTAIERGAPSLGAPLDRNNAEP